MRAFAVSAAGLLLAGSLTAQTVHVVDKDGQFRSGNVFATKLDPYIAGTGLKDGLWFFQVSDNGPTVLLSTESRFNRMVIVRNGAIVALNSGTTHAIGKAPSGSPPGAISVRLFPYNNAPAPNTCGFKVWMVHVNDYREHPWLPGDWVYGFSPKGIFNFFDVNACNDPVIIGKKFYDRNTNGRHDAGEPVIPGWKIERTPPTTPVVTFTTSNGEYAYVVDPGTYKICEVFPDRRWVATTPRCGTVTAVSGITRGPDFGNVALGAGGGRTPGFWSNKNGLRIITRGGFLARLCKYLRNEDGSVFNPTSTSAFRSWLRARNASNMAYQLSGQLAAMQCNVLAGFVRADALIHAPGTASANAAGFASVAAIVAEACEQLRQHGLTVSGHPHRARQEALKNALDRANNNRNFVLANPPSFSY